MSFWRFSWFFFNGIGGRLRCSHWINMIDRKRIVSTVMLFLYGGKFTKNFLFRLIFLKEVTPFGSRLFNIFSRCKGNTEICIVHYTLHINYVQWIELTILLVILRQILRFQDTECWILREILVLPEYIECLLPNFIVIWLSYLWNEEASLN